MNKNSLFSYYLIVSIFLLLFSSSKTAQLTAPPPESKCNSALSGCNRGGCSINTDCACYDIRKKGVNASEGMCASMMVSCSVITPCEDDRVTCKQPETICVQDHRCSNRPVCYPIALSICPPMPPTNSTVVIVTFYKRSPNATNGELLAGGREAGLAREQLYGPTSVLLTTTKDLIVCDYGNRRIQRWSHNVNYGETLIGNVACNQLLTDQNGELLFTTVTNELLKWLPAKNRTELVMKFAGKNPPKTISDVFLSRNGNVYIADSGNNRILKYTPGQDDAQIIAGGQAWKSSELTHLNQPTSVIVDDKGSLYIADYGNKRIVRWAIGDSAGVILKSSISSLMTEPVLRFDRNGNLYVSDHSSITRFDIDTNTCTADD